MRTKYRFSHRSDDGRTYYWESVSPMPNGSCVEQIRASVQWFWGGEHSELYTNFKTR